MNDHLEYIRDYLEAATESSARARRILVLLLATSILVFIAFWNSRKSGWITTHVQWAKEIEAQKTNPPVGALTENEESIKKRAASYQIENPPEAKHFHQHLLDLMAEHVFYVRVPVLGTAFDINDLGIFSGITFAVLFLWFRFALWSEWNNFRLCFIESSAEDREAVYRFLEMRQLLLVPSTLKEGEGRERVIWNRLALVLFLLPTITYGVVVWNDITTAVDLPKTTGLLGETICEVACFVIVLILSAFCVQLLVKIKREWEEFAQIVRNWEP